MDRYNLIVRNLAEVIEDKNEIINILKTRDLNLYWGTAPTGEPHCGYFVPIIKIGDFLKAGCNVTILFADIHASLDNLKSTFEEVINRTKYYEFIIKEMLKLFNIPLDKLKFIKGSEFQLSKSYTMNIYKLTSLCTINKAKRSGAKVVKQQKNPLLSSLLYPLLQSLDEEYLKVDGQFGGIDQRKIFMLSREYLPKLGFKKRIHLMNPLIPGLTKTGKMSSSIPKSKINFLDTDEEIKKKIMKAYSIDGVIHNNCLLMILKYIIFPKLMMTNKNFGVYTKYEHVENDFKEKKFLSIELKHIIYKEIISLITPLRNIIIKNKKLHDNAYR